MTEKKSWLDDPHLARRLARFTWVVLVTAFVLVTRLDLGHVGTRAALSVVIAVVGILNAPVAIGLWRSRAEAHTRPFQLVALALLLRIAGLIWVLSITPT